MKPWFIKAFLLFLFLKCASIFALFIFLQRRERDIFWEVKGQINLPKFEAAADHTTKLALLHSSWSVNWRSSFLASVVLTKQPLALKIYISIKFINFLISNSFSRTRESCFSVKLQLLEVLDSIFEEMKIWKKEDFRVKIRNTHILSALKSYW